MFQIVPHAFSLVLQWVYTLRFEIELDYIEPVLLLAKQCQLTDLEYQLNEKISSVQSFRK